MHGTSAVSDTVEGGPAPQWLVPMSNFGDDASSQTTSVWRTDDPRNVVPQVLFRPEYSGDRATVAIVRVLEIGSRIAARIVVWSGYFGISDEAELRYQWLHANPFECTRLGSLAQLFGLDEVTSEIEVGVAAARLLFEEEQEREIERAEKARLRAEKDEAKARIIGSYLEDRDGQFGVGMRRGNSKKSFWIIFFREKSQRERFNDWFRWQSHQFTAWATYLEDHTNIELERLLIAEMQATEQRIKALGPRGLAERGPRPLRFWRGEE